MWCSRCKKKFCQLCLKPVSFIPVHMHLFVCEASFKDKSFSYFMSIFFLTFCIFFYQKSFQSYSYSYSIPILLLMHYCFHMFFEWIESLNSVMGMFMLALLAGIITVIIPLLLGFRITVQVANTACTVSFKSLEMSCW